MIQGDFAAKGPGKPFSPPGNCGLLYQSSLEADARPFEHLKHDQHWVMLQVNDPKHTSKSTQEWLTNKGIRVLV